MTEDIIQAPIKYNLACGNNKVEGYINVDIIKTDATDEVINLEEFPWNIPDSSVDEILCSHYVEHTKDLIKFMDECHRILKQNGKMTVIAPYYTSVRASQDPTHIRAISEYTFIYFNKEWRNINKLNHYPIVSDFDFTYGYVMAPEFATRNDETKRFAILHYWNVVNDIQVILTKR